MANAIHKTDGGDTLTGIAARYYALESASGTLRDVELVKVTDAIRRATPELPATLKDAGPLPTGTILRVPTLRELNRAILAAGTVVSKALRDFGFEHARKMLRYGPASLVKLLTPLPAGVSEADIRRTWILTALLDLDGMDIFTARQMQGAMSINTLVDLARQSTAAIDAFLATLVAPPNSRPSELQQQGHAERWILGAKIQVRDRIGELTKIRGRYFQIPFSADAARERADFFENLKSDAATSADDAELAARLTRLHRFQAAAIRGHFGLRTGQWSEAIAGYQEARRQWHRLAEEIGAASAVADDAGVNFKTCLEVASRLLSALPGDDDAPLGAPAIVPRQRGTTYRYSLRSFRYDELAHDRQLELQNSLAAAPIHRLPRKTRAGIFGAALQKTRRELKAADPNLLAGLDAGADTVLARDFGQAEKDILRRNLGGTPVSGTLPSGTGLGLFDPAGSGLALSELVPLLPALWNAPAAIGAVPAKLPATSVLSDAAKGNLPADVASRSDVTPFSKLVVLPGESGRTSVRMFPLSGNFSRDYEEQVLKPRFMSQDGEDLVFDESIWTDSGAFAAIAPYVYASQIPLGLRRAYGMIRQPALARKFGGQRINFYKSDGTPVRDVSAIDPGSLAFDPDLLACSTSWTGGSVSYVASQFELESYASGKIEDADFAYRQDSREQARSLYADAKCAIEQVYPDFEDQARLGLTGVYNTIRDVNLGTFTGRAADRNLAKLSTLNVQFVQDGNLHGVLEGTVLPVRAPLQRSGSTTAALSASQRFFEWNALVGIDHNGTKTAEQAVEEALDEDTSGDGMSSGDTTIFIDHSPAPSTAAQVPIPGRAEFYSLYLYCEAKINAIDAGLNWYGFGDEFVPCWSFELLYEVSRDLCNRALDAEERVFTLLQMYQTAANQEFLATQQEQLAGAELDVAQAQVAQQVASNALASAQAAYAQEQAQAQANKSGVESQISELNAVISFGGLAFGLIAGGPAGAFAVGKATQQLTGQSWLQSGESFAASVANHKQDIDVLNAAMSVSAATLEASTAALAVAVAQQDVSSTKVQQASDYVDFLQSQDLNSEAYIYLMARAKEILEVYIQHANRMSWLAERALENETRQSFDLIKIDYTVNDGLADMTRAQQLTADLEALRSQYVAGQTVRLQEMKWTAALSQLDPIAWRDLRATGTCTFVLRQRTLDQLFPGMFQHRLKDVAMEIVGLVPPEGARGILTNPGISWVRVPNDQPFLDGQTKPDWVTGSLDGSTKFAHYDQYVMKRLLTGLVSVALTQFDVAADRAVLSSPQGMLKPVEHQGLDSAWTLRLQRQANNFDFGNISDVEFTFWFLAAYDPGLEEAQGNALTEDGNRGKLTAASRNAFALKQQDAWAGFVSPPSDPEALDLRYLTLDVGGLPPWEKERRLTNVLIGFARALGRTDELTVRLCCQYDPVGILLTTKNGSSFTLIDVDTSTEVPAPQPDAALGAWVRDVFYLTVPPIQNPGSPGGPGPVSQPGPTVPRPSPTISVPIRDPQVRWAIKASPAQMTGAWLGTDDDGRPVTATSGPLEGAAGAVAVFRDGSSWTDYNLEAKVSHRGTTVRLRLRDSGTSHFALQISPGDVKLIKVLNGVETVLGSPLALAYPADEYLTVDFRIVGGAISAAVDGITLFDRIDGTPGTGPLTRGSVSLQVVGGNALAAFDDVSVVRLTGKGATAEMLMSEPFTSVLPKTWTFQDGTTPWSISTAALRRLDLSGLLNAVLNLDYRYQIVLN